MGNFFVKELEWHHDERGCWDLPRTPRNDAALSAMYTALVRQFHAAASRSTIERLQDAAGVSPSIIGARTSSADAGDSGLASCQVYPPSVILDTNFSLPWRFESALHVEDVIGPSGSAARAHNEAAIPPATSNPAVHLAHVNLKRKRSEFDASKVKLESVTPATVDEEGVWASQQGSEHGDMERTHWAHEASFFQQFEVDPHAPAIFTRDSAEPYREQHSKLTLDAATMAQHIAPSCLHPITPDEFGYSLWDRRHNGNAHVALWSLRHLLIHLALVATHTQGLQNVAELVDAELHFLRGTSASSSGGGPVPMKPATFAALEEVGYRPFVCLLQGELRVAVARRGGFMVWSALAQEMYRVLAALANEGHRIVNIKARERLTMDGDQTSLRGSSAALAGLMALLNVPHATAAIRAVLHARISTVSPLQFHASLNASSAHSVANSPQDDPLCLTRTLDLDLSPQGHHVPASGSTDETGSTIAAQRELAARHSRKVLESFPDFLFVPLNEDVGSSEATEQVVASQFVYGVFCTLLHDFARDEEERLQAMRKQGRERRAQAASEARRQQRERDAALVHCPGVDGDKPSQRQYCGADDAGNSAVSPASPLHLEPNCTKGPLSSLKELSRIQLEPDEKEDTDGDRQLSEATIADVVDHLRACIIAEELHLSPPLPPAPHGLELEDSGASAAPSAPCISTAATESEHTAVSGAQSSVRARRHAHLTPGQMRILHHRVLLDTSANLFNGTVTSEAADAVAAGSPETVMGLEVKPSANAAGLQRVLFVLALHALDLQLLTRHSKPTSQWESHIRLTPLQIELEVIGVHRLCGIDPVHCPLRRLHYTEEYDAVSGVHVPPWLESGSDAIYGFLAAHLHDSGTPRVIVIAATTTGFYLARSSVLNPFLVLGARSDSQEYLCGGGAVDVGQVLSAHLPPTCGGDKLLQGRPYASLVALLASISEHFASTLQLCQWTLRAGGDGSTSRGRRLNGIDIVHCEELRSDEYTPGLRRCLDLAEQQSSGRAAEVAEVSRLQERQAKPGRGVNSFFASCAPGERVLTFASQSASVRAEANSRRERRDLSPSFGRGKANILVPRVPASHAPKLLDPRNMSSRAPDRATRGPLNRISNDKRVSPRKSTDRCSSDKPKSISSSPAPNKSVHLRSKHLRHFAPKLTAQALQVNCNVLDRSLSVPALARPRESWLPVVDDDACFPDVATLIVFSVARSLLLCNGEAVESTSLAATQSAGMVDTTESSIVNDTEARLSPSPQRSFLFASGALPYALEHGGSPPRSVDEVNGRAVAKIAWRFGVSDLAAASTSNGAASSIFTSRSGTLTAVADIMTDVLKISGASKAIALTRSPQYNAEEFFAAVKQLCSIASDASDAAADPVRLAYVLEMSFRHDVMGLLAIAAWPYSQAKLPDSYTADSNVQLSLVEALKVMISVVVSGLVQTRVAVLSTASMQWAVALLSQSHISISQFCPGFELMKEAAAAGVIQVVRNRLAAAARILDQASCDARTRHRSPRSAAAATTSEWLGDDAKPCESKEVDAALVALQDAVASLDVKEYHAGAPECAGIEQAFHGEDEARTHAATSCIFIASTSALSSAFRAKWSASPRHQSGQLSIVRLLVALLEGNADHRSEALVASAAIALKALFIPPATYSINRVPLQPLDESAASLPQALLQQLVRNPCLAQTSPSRPAYGLTSIIALAWLTARLSTRHRDALHHGGITDVLSEAITRTMLRRARVPHAAEPVWLAYSLISAAGGSPPTSALLYKVVNDFCQEATSISGEAAVGANTVGTTSIKVPLGGLDHTCQPMEPLTSLMKQGEDQAATNARGGSAAMFAALASLAVSRSGVCILRSMRHSEGSVILRASLGALTLTLRSPPPLHNETISTVSTAAAAVVAALLDSRLLRPRHALRNQAGSFRAISHGGPGSPLRKAASVASLNSTRPLARSSRSLASSSSNDLLTNQRQELEEQLFAEQIQQLLQHNMPLWIQPLFAQTVEVLAKATALATELLLCLSDADGCISESLTSLQDQHSQVHRALSIAAAVAASANFLVLDAAAGQDVSDPVFDASPLVMHVVKLTNCSAAVLAAPSVQHPISALHCELRIIANGFVLGGMATTVFMLGQPWCSEAVEVGGMNWSLIEGAFGTPEDRGVVFIAAQCMASSSSLISMNSRGEDMSIIANTEARTHLYCGEGAACFAVAALNYFASLARIRPMLDLLIGAHDSEHNCILRSAIAPLFHVSLSGSEHYRHIDELRSVQVAAAACAAAISSLASNHPALVAAGTELSKIGAAEVAFMILSSSCDPLSAEAALETNGGGGGVRPRAPHASPVAPVSLNAAGLGPAMAVPLHSDGAALQALCCVRLLRLRTSQLRATMAERVSERADDGACLWLPEVLRSRFGDPIAPLAAAAHATLSSALQSELRALIVLWQLGDTRGSIQ